MSNNHTPEPWVIRKGDWSTHGTLITTAKRGRNKTVAVAEVDTEGFSKEFGDEQKANAKRIVKCVNAMAGIDDDNALFLKESSVRKTISKMALDHQETKLRCDKLKSALEEITKINWRDGLYGLDSPTDFAEREVALRALGKAITIAREAIK